jgi:hypothetical protein
MTWLPGNAQLRHHITKAPVLVPGPLCFQEYQGYLALLRCTTFTARRGVFQ